MKPGIKRFSGASELSNPALPDSFPQQMSTLQRTIFIGGENGSLH